MPLDTVASDIALHLRQSDSLKDAQGASKYAVKGSQKIVLVEVSDCRSPLSIALFRTRHQSPTMMMSFGRSFGVNAASTRDYLQ